MTGHAKVGGAWKDVDSIHAKVGGSWKEVIEGHTKIGGVWKQFYSATQPLSSEFVGSFEDIGSGPTYTFSNIDIGQTGLVVVSVGAEQAGRTIDSVTIGGITASTAIYPSAQGAVSQGIFYAEITGSTTVDVVVTFSGTQFRMVLGVWRINNYVSTSPRFTYADEGNDATRSITTDSLLDNSVIIAGVSEANAALFSWSGVSEDYDTTTSEDNSTLSGASTQVSSSGAVTVSSTFSGTPGQSALTVAVWDESNLVPVQYLVIAGGGGGGNTRGGGGGAGGYRSSVSGESSGGGASAEELVSLVPGTDYTVTIGAGGAGATTFSAKGSLGNNSVFANITSIAGGGGGSRDSDAGSDGGSGGGSSANNESEQSSGSGGSGTTGQGFDGGTTPGTGSILNRGGSGGGGASQQGENGEGVEDGDGGNGGNGVTSSITGTAVTRAGGGGGGAWTNLAGDGGSGGGGAGTAGIEVTGTSGTANTGGGGGGGSAGSGDGGSGGSGIVILRYPSSFTITIGAGLTGTTTTVGANKVTTITSGSGTVSWS